MWRRKSDVGPIGHKVGKSKIKQWESKVMHGKRVISLSFSVVCPVKPRSGRESVSLNRKRSI